MVILSFSSSQDSKNIAVKRKTLNNCWLSDEYKISCTTIMLKKSAARASDSQLTYKLQQNFNSDVTHIVNLLCSLFHILHVIVKEQKKSWYSEL